MSRVEGELGRAFPDELPIPPAQKPETQDPEVPLFPKPSSNLSPRDFDRWPEIAGFPPISGASREESEEDKRKLRPLSELADRVDLSKVRLQALLKEGKIDGERRRVGRGPKNWFTSVEAVEEYQKNLPTPAEFGRKGGRKGGLMAGRGRPKSDKSSKTP